ncbi:hypothetical protein GQ457_08G009110 [Hibiscus cannabinus]
MASSLSTTPAAPFSSVVKAAATSPYLPLSKLSFRVSNRPNPRFFSKSLQTGQNCSVVVKAKLNEVEVDGSSNASTTPPVESGLSTAELKDAKPSSNVSPPALATEEPISEFLNQVSSLVKLVDSRDIVELQLKQLDCILSPPVGPPTHTAPAPAPAAATPAPSPAAPKSAKSLLPPLKCPMAGTFYRSPTPGEPPFVKVGDKVQKGQVICIIEENEVDE